MPLFVSAPSGIGPFHPRSKVSIGHMCQVEEKQSDKLIVQVNPFTEHGLFIDVLTCLQLVYSINVSC